MAALEYTRAAHGAGGLFGRVGTVCNSAISAIMAWNDTRTTRNALASLSDRELDDIGLVRGDIDLIAQGRGLR